MEESDHYTCKVKDSEDHNKYIQISIHEDDCEFYGCSHDDFFKANIMNQAKEINTFDLSSTSDADNNNKPSNKYENASGDGISNHNGLSVCYLLNEFWAFG